MIDRRTFIVALLAVYGCGQKEEPSKSADASQATPPVTEVPPVGRKARKVYRIGILVIGTASDFVGPQPRNPQVNAFLRRLGELGYVYGQHFLTEPRGSEGKPERFPTLAAELVRLQVDVIVAPEPALPALKLA